MDQQTDSTFSLFEYPNKSDIQKHSTFIYSDMYITLNQAKKTTYLSTSFITFRNINSHDADNQDVKTSNFDFKILSL